MPRKKTEAPALHIAKRSGTTKNGGTFRLMVGVMNVEINGVAISSEMAADVLAGVIHGALIGGSEENAEEDAPLPAPPGSLAQPFASSRGAAEFIMSVAGLVESEATVEAILTRASAFDSTLETARANAGNTPQTLARVELAGKKIRERFRI